MKLLLLIAIIALSPLLALSQGRTTERIVSVPFSQLSTSHADGSTRIVINGTAGAPCTVGPSQVLAVKLNGVWTCTDLTASGGSGGAPLNATFITQTPNSELTAEQALSAMATGILKGNTGTGVVTIAVAGTDYLAPAGNGSQLTSLNATQLTSGTVPDARFPAILPVASGINLTALNATNLASGTVGHARLGTGGGGATKFLREDNTWQTIGGGGDALVANPLSQFASTTSGQFATVITNETGTDLVVFSTSPALAGTPTAPTAAAGTNTTQLATTAHVFAERTNTSTLSGKTISGASNTLTNLPAANIIGVIPIANLATGTPNGAKFIRDDGTLQAIPGGGDALVASPLSQFAATTSAQLAGVITNETGTGLLVYGTAPNITSPVGIVKGDVGLGNADNTSDALKPVSTDQQAALDLKANLASPTFTGAPALPTGTIAVTQTAGNSTTAIATTAFVTTADNLKAPIASPTFTGTVAFPTPFTLGGVSVLPTGTELNFVDGVTSAIQTQLDAKQAADADLTTWAGLTPSVNAQSLVTAANYAAMRALLDLEAGTDFLAFPTGTPTGSKFLRDDNSWQLITGGGDALVANPLSQFAATTSAQLAGVLSDETGTGVFVRGTSPNIVTPTGIVKGDVGLTNVDNTSDVNKPVSTAQQTALDLKANLASPTFTGTVTMPTPFTLGAVSVLPTGTELNFVDGVTSSIQTQLDARALAGAITSSGLTMATARLLGRSTASTGAVEEITVGSGLSLAAGVLTATAGGGDMLLGTSQTVTARKLFNPATLVIGNVATPPTPELGSLFVDTDDGKLYYGIDGSTHGEVFVSGLSVVNLASGNVSGDLPFANFVPATAASKLAGRGSASGAGDFEEITIGSGLTMTGTTLSSSGSATIVNGTSALGTSAITSGACASVVTTTATGTATTDTISWGFNSDPTGVTGYAPVTTGALTIFAYPSTNNVNFKVCNLTNASVTPGAITLNWRILR